MRDLIFEMRAKALCTMSTSPPDLRREYDNNPHIKQHAAVAALVAQVPGITSPTMSAAWLCDAQTTLEQINYMCGPLVASLVAEMSPGTPLHLVAASPEAKTIMLARCIVALRDNPRMPLLHDYVCELLPALQGGDPELYIKLLETLQVTGVAA